MIEQNVKDIRKDVYLAMHKAQTMLELAEEGFLKNKVASLDQADELAGEIHSREDNLTSVLASLASSSNDARNLLPVPGHIEKIATCIKRITDSSRERIKEGLLFSDKALSDTEKLFAKSKDILKKAGEASVTTGASAVDTVLAESDALERMSNDFATKHEERLVTGECAPKSSSTYLCMLYAFEDMGFYIKSAVKKISGRA